MGVGVSIVLITAGAILTWGVEADPQGINLGAVGVILLVAGLAGLLLSMAFWNQATAWPGPRQRRVVERDDWADEPPVRRRRVVRTREYDDRI